MLPVKTNSPAVLSACLLAVLSYPLSTVLPYLRKGMVHSRWDEYETRASYVWYATFWWTKIIFFSTWADLSWQILFFSACNFHDYNDVSYLILYWYMIVFIAGLMEIHVSTTQWILFFPSNLSIVLPIQCDLIAVSWDLGDYSPILQSHVYVTILAFFGGKKEKDFGPNVAEKKPDNVIQVHPVDCTQNPPKQLNLKYHDI